mgnify:FL=1
MRTDTERTQQILQRTAQLKRARQVRRQHLTELGCAAACLALVVCIGAWMPGWVGTPVAVSASVGGTASILGQGSAGGYILVGLLSFLLGSCVTILLYRLRRRSEKKQQTGEHHEL